MTSRLHASTRHARTPAVLIAVLVGVAALSAACGGSHSATAQPTTSATVTTGATSSVSTVGIGAPAIPAGAYLGAWVNPAKSSGEAPATTDGPEIAQLPTFESAVSADPALLNIYTAFNAAAPISQLDAIAAKGAIPLLAWGCASTSAISSGQDDAKITAFADGLKTFAHPVFLRWFWEMNLPGTAHSKCLGSGGAAGFISAWQHMYTLFQQAGATNVAFVWCPGISGGLPKLETYFPGNAYVNWYGIDGYAHKTNDFGSIFQGWYSEYASNGKPMIICETGALPAGQTAYLASVQRELPTQFTQVKGFVYFDAAGPNGAWELTADGLAAFKNLSHDSYFTSRA